MMKKRTLIFFGTLAVATFLATYALKAVSAPPDCAGGSCTYEYNTGEKCTACCPIGDRPECNSFGCTCRSR